MRKEDNYIDSSNEGDFHIIIVIKYSHTPSVQYKFSTLAGRNDQPNLNLIGHLLC